MKYVYHVSFTGRRYFIKRLFGTVTIKSLVPFDNPEIILQAEEGLCRQIRHTPGTLFILHFQLLRTEPE